MTSDRPVSICSSIEDAMASWHVVQTVASKNPSRKLLHDHWSNILALLQNCHEFESPDVDVDVDAAAWLKELHTLSNPLCLQSLGLVRQCDEITESLSSLTPQLTALLRGPAKFNPAAFPVTAAFLGIGSPPDGLTALTSMTTALAAIRAILCSLHHFWTAVSEACRAPKQIIVRADIHKLEETWRDYQEEILQAKASIARSQDALVIGTANTDNVPVPTRRQPRRRGSSKSEASSSSFSSPRRMSGLDDDEVPKCWGFAFSKSRW
ncbi:hypothetical protein C8R46DRAFT_1065991 [Mycena filopes]|nr:hypothetical protein C8R46DRAFT_1065991 [Mycena filopes]